MQFRAAYRAAAVDSMFVVSRNSNCIEDTDSFLLKLKGVTQDPQAPTPASMSLPPHMTDLLSIANAPHFSIEEDNIVVYIAGYLARKAANKYPCTGCKQQLLSILSGTGEKFTFFNRKQYSHLTEGGLSTPSEALINFATELETIFRVTIPGVIHSDKVRGKLFLRAAEADLPSITCNTCTQTKDYIILLFITVRLHHLLREQNRKFQAPNQKRNRKMMKLLHI